MRVSEIQVGKTYVNRGAGRTRRHVLGIGDQYRPKIFYSRKNPPREHGVLFEQGGKEHTLYISSFANWAGHEVS